MHESRVVVFSGGGTGGHLYPALALADALRELRPDVGAYFVGASRGLEARVLPERGEQHLLLSVEGIDRTRPLSSWRALPALVGSVFRVLALFRKIRPEAVVVTGGYAGAPAGIGAKLLGIPLLLQEQNSVPGFSTRRLSPWASLIHLAFPEARARLPRAARDRVRVSGNPVRPPWARNREEARALFGLPTDAFVVLVTGGSQGARALNEALTRIVRADGAARAGDREVHVLWVTGPKHFDAVVAELGPERASWAHVIPYAEDMPAAMAAADLAVSRSGAMTTAELLNAGLPSILVPLPTAAANHQAHNAEALAAAGAAMVAPEASLSADGLWAEILRLAGDPEALAQMRAAALRRARPDAAREIAADVDGLLATRSRVR